VGVAEEKKEACQKEGGEAGGDPPTEPKAGTEKDGGADEEGSCFSQSHEGFYRERCSG
jgi:hypothetical protein